MNTEHTQPGVEPCGERSDAFSEVIRASLGSGSPPTSDTATSDESSPSSFAEPAAEPLSTSKKVQFTGKVRRGLALMRMVQMAATSEDCPPIPTFVSRWSKAWVSDYNAALAWMEQEEDWESVEDAWDRGRTGKAGGK